MIIRCLTGTYTPETVTIASDYVTLYKYENGLVKAIPQTTTENTPEIAIDYIAEKLTGFIDGGNYTIMMWQLCLKTANLQ